MKEATFKLQNTRLIALSENKRLIVAIACQLLLILVNFMDAWNLITLSTMAIFAFITSLIIFASIAESIKYRIISYIISIALPGLMVIIYFILGFVDLYYISVIITGTWISLGIGFMFYKKTTVLKFSLIIALIFFTILLLSCLEIGLDSIALKGEVKTWTIDPTIGFLIAIPGIVAFVVLMYYTNKRGREVKRTKPETTRKAREKPTETPSTNPEEYTKL